jgi:hypothetical protein
LQAQYHRKGCDFVTPLSGHLFQAQYLKVICNAVSYVFAAPSSLRLPGEATCGRTGAGGPLLLRLAGAKPGAAPAGTLEGPGARSFPGSRTRRAPGQMHFGILEKVNR